MNDLVLRMGQFLAMGAALCAVSGPLWSSDMGVDSKSWSDPLTRYIHVRYKVPSNAPQSAEVSCSWSPAGKNDWKPASVTPLISETGLSLATDAELGRWALGKLTERRAAGLTRTVVFDPYPAAQVDGRVDADFKVVVSTPQGDQLASEIVPLHADNTDVTYVTAWSGVIQQNAVSTTPTEGRWLSKDGVLRAASGTQLPTLTYPLDLKGAYAIFVSTDPSSERAALRLSGDERTENVASTPSQKEILWRWTQMDRQHLLIKQRFTFTGWNEVGLKYVKLVPLSKPLENSLDSQFSGRHDKFLATYFEPYSWAFCTDIEETGRHREPITAYADARVDLLDIQVVRIGMKAVFETRFSDQLLYRTMGDPIDGKVPVTSNVGRMQQYTNTLETELRYARDLHLNASANFGAGNSYPGSPLNSEFSEKHPDWLRESSLKYEIPEVRRYVLGLIRESLDIGAPGVSIDFCRYPECVDSADTCTKFIRELRGLADEFGRVRGRHVPILIRFPAIGATRWKCFDYGTWAREGLVDFLCPSNITGTHQWFDIKPYVSAAKGTKCKVTPVIDAIIWGPVMPYGFLERVKSIYDAGADGVYIYQGDDPIVYHPWSRRYVTIARSSEAVDRWIRNEAVQQANRSKGIFVTKPFDGKAYGFYERMRIHLEGTGNGKVETYLDGKLIGRFTAPPYILGTDDDASNKVVTNGIHTLTIRAEDGNGWLEQQFTIEGRE